MHTKNMRYSHFDYRRYDYIYDDYSNILVTIVKQNFLMHNLTCMRAVYRVRVLVTVGDTKLLSWNIIHL